MPWFPNRDGSPCPLHHQSLSQKPFCSTTPNFHLLISSNCLISGLAELEFPWTTNKSFHASVARQEPDVGQPVMPKSRSSGSSKPRQGSAGVGREKGWIPLLPAGPSGKVGSPPNLLSPGLRSQRDPCPGGFMDHVHRKTLTRRLSL